MLPDINEWNNRVYGLHAADTAAWQNRGAQARQKAGINGGVGAGVFGASATTRPGTIGTGGTPSSGPAFEARSGLGHFGGSATSGPSAPGATPASNPYGSQSGPGILEQWFNERANGTDPGYQYAMNRGMNDIDSRMAAGGSYNSGARGQQLSDFAANMGAQRESQLDALAGGASGEHLGRLGMMFGEGQAIAGGQAGQASAYDLGAAGNMAAANNAQTQMNLNKAGIDSQANQAFYNNILAAYGLSRSGGGGGGGGGGGYSDPYGYDYGKV